MAQIGLKYLKYSAIKDGKLTGGAKVLGKAIKFKPTPKIASGSLSADDTIAEEYDEIIGGDIEAEVDDISVENYAEVFGHKIDETSKVVTRNANDEPIHIRVGRIITKLNSGVKKYKVEILNDVKLKETELPEETTKGDSITFVTRNLKGSFYIQKDGEWSMFKYFDTLEDAVTYLDSSLASE